ncbi:MAG TPA: carboxymuconolactone decarboxylase family protein [Vicinamibacterales bacterium]|nr:carboxymuconolactone decarboxylase family protein [Vicinamibacterales bacterium]
MSQFPIFTTDTAPADSKSALQRSQRAFGFVPNLLGVLAGAPAALHAYLALRQSFSSGTLTEVERQVVLLSVSREHACEYCMAAHSAIATSAGMPAEVLDALRRGESLPDARLETLRQTTQALVARRGWLPPEELERFLASGYTSAQLLEVVTGIAQKTLSNYTNHLAQTPVDPQFESFAWSREQFAHTK